MRTVPATNNDRWSDHLSIDSMCCHADLQSILFTRRGEGGSQDREGSNGTTTGRLKGHAETSDGDDSGMSTPEKARVQRYAAKLFQFGVAAKVRELQNEMPHMGGRSWLYSNGRAFRGRAGAGWAEDGIPDRQCQSPPCCCFHQSHIRRITQSSMKGGQQMAQGLPSSREARGAGPQVMPSAVCPARTAVLRRFPGTPSPAPPEASHPVLT